MMSDDHKLPSIGEIADQIGAKPTGNKATAFCYIDDTPLVEMRRSVGDDLFYYRVTCGYQYSGIDQQTLRSEGEEWIGELRTEPEFLRTFQAMLSDPAHLEEEIRRVRRLLEKVNDPLYKKGN